nr:tRNA epoxyqueuosine(34) reductase QueG [Candidatus Methylospira mobilis]
MKIQKPVIPISAGQLAELAARIKGWGMELGFQHIGITDIVLEDAEKHLQQWLADGFHGEMSYMETHGSKRTRPDELVPGTVRVICARIDYLPEPAALSEERLNNALQAFVSRYALGRDYHKLVRSRLQRLAARIETEVGAFGYRVFSDSAPVMEKALAEKSGLGWIGKHSNLIAREAGSWFFLGEIYTDLPLPCDDVVSNNCGTCIACMAACPTQAIVAPYRVDARRCISYLTIELHGSIPLEFRKAIGNRIYGCDDCQLACPWNRFATQSAEADFRARHGLDTLSLIDALSWDEYGFLKKTEGSAIRRIGHQRWQRNVAIALGNSSPSPSVISALQQQLAGASELVGEHLLWALEQHYCSR